MKFSSINISVLGASLLLCAAAFTSCCNDNDWDTDGTHNRPFHTTTLTVDPKDDRAGIIFDKIPNAIGYQVELSRDTLHDGIELNANGKSQVFVLHNSPDTIYDLQGATKYFIRMRTIGEGETFSKWKYLAKYSFTTKSEQIITDIIPSSTSAIVKFVPGKTIDEAYIYRNEDSTKLDNSTIDIANGVVTVTGLLANTTYRIKLWNEKNVRGNMVFKTTEAFPEGYDIINLTAGDDLNTILASATNDKVVILMAPGMEYSMPIGEEGNPKTPNIPANITSVYFWGAAGEVQPIFHVRGMGLEGNKDIIRFYNTALINDGPSDHYVLNIKGNYDINKIQIDKCTIKDTRGVVRFQSITGGTVGEVTINNCQISNIGSYGVFNSKGQSALTLKELNISNTTMNGVAAGALINIHQENAKVNIDHCTIYNCVQAGKPIIDVNKLESIVPYVANTLIGPFNGSDGEKTIKGCSLKSVDVNNTFYTNDQLWNSGYELGNMIDASSTDFWTNAAEGDFSITISYRDEYSKYGDPRWVTE